MITISASGANAGNVQFYDKPIFATDCSTVYSNEHSNKYLFYCLQHIQKKIFSMQSGLAQPHVYPKDLEKIILTLPSERKEQEKIAEILGEVDKAIDSTKKLIDKYTLIKEGMLQDLLTNGIDEKGQIRSEATHKYKDSPLGRIPVEWDCVELSYITELITKLAGFEYSKYFNSYLDGGDIIVIRGINITNNCLDLSDTKHIPNKISELLHRSRLCENDLVFAYVGTVGPVWLVDKDNAYHLGPNTAKIRVKKTYSANYIYEYFKSKSIQKEITKYLSIGAQASLSMSKIRRFKLLLPKAYNEQLLISQSINSVNRILEKEHLYLKKLQLKKQALMQDLLNNKVSVDCLL